MCLIGVGGLLCSALCSCAGSDESEAETAACTARDTAVTMEVGTTPSREPDIDFTPIEDGEAVALEFGSQSAYMVVFGVKTNATPDAGRTARLTATLTRDDGTVLSHLAERVVPLLDGGDGHLYATKWILELRAADPVLRLFDWDGATATLDVSLTTECDGRMDASLTVMVKL